MSKHILKKTNRKVAVRISGDGADETITLATDCKLDEETLETTQEVNILSMQWTGAKDSTATITRGSGDPIVLLGDAATLLDFDGTDYCDNIDSTEDINVVLSGNITVYLTLRKQSGYTITDPTSFTF